jgi:hypothetical protein
VIDGIAVGDGVGRRDSARDLVRGLRSERTVAPTAPFCWKSGGALGLATISGIKDGGERVSHERGRRFAAARAGYKGTVPCPDHDCIHEVGGFARPATPPGGEVTCR